MAIVERDIDKWIRGSDGPGLSTSWSFSFECWYFTISFTEQVNDELQKRCSKVQGLRISINARTCTVSITAGN